MKMIKASVFVLLVISIFSCKSSEKTSEMADGMCNCFNKMKDSIPPEAIAVFEKAASAADAKASFAEGMKNLPVETALKVNAALMSTAKKGSPMNDCIKELDKKYKTNSKSQEEMGQKMIAEIKDKKGCEIMLALLKMNAKK